MTTGQILNEGGTSIHYIGLIRILSLDSLSSYPMCSGAIFDSVDRWFLYYLLFTFVWTQLAHRICVEVVIVDSRHLNLCVACVLDNLRVISTS